MTDYAGQILGGNPAADPMKPRPAAAQGTDYAGQLLGGNPAAPQPAAAPAQEEPGFFGSLYEGMKESITGEQRRLHDWEEVPVNVALPKAGVDTSKPLARDQVDTIPIQDHMAFARDNDLARSEIFQNYLPEAKVYWDENMTPYTDYFGEPRYLNTPGASRGDLSEAIQTVPAEIASAMGAGKVGQLIGKKILLPGAMQSVGAGAGLYGASVAQDKVAEVLGSDQPVDHKRARMMAVFGMGGEAASIVLGRFLSRFASSNKMVDKQGNVTPAGRKILEQNNIDPEGATPQFMKVWASLADDAVDPAHAVALAEAATLPKSVRLSKGDVTRDVNDQAFEIAAVKGSRGEAPKEKMTAFREGQQDDLLANEQAIQSVVGSADTPRVSAQGEGMGRVQADLAGRYKTARQAVKEAYDRASKTGASVATVNITDMGRYITKQLASYNPHTASKTFGTLKGLMPEIGNTARPIAVNLKHLENKRQQLSKLTRGSDPVEASAARRAISAYDKYMNALLERGLILGDDATLASMKQARRLRAKMGDLFESDRLMTMIMDTKKGELVLTSKEAMNVLFTTSGLGAKKSGVKALKQIRKVLGADSPAWKDLREEAILRLFQSTRSRELGENLQRAFSPAKFVSAMDDTFTRDRELMNVLFTAKEQGLLRQLRNVSARLIPKRGADNYSNTAAEVLRVMQGVFGPGAAITRDLLGTMSKKYRETRSERLVDTATSPINAQRVPEVKALPPGAVGGFSGLGADPKQLQQQQQERRR